MGRKKRSQRDTGNRLRRASMERVKKHLRTVTSIKGFDDVIANSSGTGNAALSWHDQNHQYSRKELFGILNINRTAIAQLKTLSLSEGFGSADPSYPDVILTAAAISYKNALLNWLFHLSMQGIHNYIVLCFDVYIYDLVAPGHRVLMLESLSGFLDAINHKNNTHHTGFESKGNDPKKSKKHFVTIENAANEMRLNITEFEIMMVAKYTAIGAVLRNNQSLLWADADALLLRPCALSTFQAIPHYIDLIAQQGRSPFQVSRKTGSTICTGFFMVRPSFITHELMFRVKEKLYWDALFNYYLGRRGDDQSKLNELVFSFGGFHYLDGAAIYGDAELLQVAYSRPPKARPKVSIAIALLPYRLYPRGKISVPLKHFQSYRDILPPKYRSSVYTGGPKFTYNFSDVSTSRFDELFSDDLNTTVSALQGDTNSNASDELAVIKDARWEEQASEWARFADRACVWHMLTLKQGIFKHMAMRRDNVWRLDGSDKPNSSSLHIFQGSQYTNFDANYTQQASQIVVRVANDQILGNWFGSYGSLNIEDSSLPSDTDSSVYLAYLFLVGIVLCMLSIDHFQQLRFLPTHKRHRRP